MDCFFGAADFVFSAYEALFKDQSVFGRSVLVDRREHIDGRPVHGISRYEHQGRATTVVAHVPVGNNATLRQASLASGNNGTWDVHASGYRGDKLTHHILYRLASEEDLGRPNDGSYHHYRVQPARILSGGKLQKRTDRFDDAGIVVDYIWKNNFRERWCCFSGSANLLGSNTAYWMERNSAEAACAVPALQDPQGNWATVDNAAMAYGWNDVPYNWQGHSGAWLEECSFSGGDLYGGCYCK